MTEARAVCVDIDGEELAYEVVGARSWGTDEVLLDHDDDLSAAAPWAAEGYAVAAFVAEPDAVRLRDGVRDLVAGLVADLGGTEQTGGLEHYHRWVDEASHQAVSSAVARGFPLSELPIDVSVVEARVSEIAGVPVWGQHPERDPIWAVRLVRPGRSRDHNAPHRDQWIDYLRHGLNLYVPLAGSTQRSSLPLVPGSHRWPESEFEHTGLRPVVGGVPYFVPALTGSRSPVRMIRPDPAPGECLVFSPYLLHGGGVNLEPDTTRVSIEMRFWRRT